MSNKTTKTTTLKPALPAIARQVLARLVTAERISEETGRVITAAACREAAEFISAAVSRINELEQEIINLRAISLMQK